MKAFTRFYEKSTTPEFRFQTRLVRGVLFIGLALLLNILIGSTIHGRPVWIVFGAIASAGAFQIVKALRSRR